MLERVMSVRIVSLNLKRPLIPTYLLTKQTFDENPTLDGILAELIIPAVKSKDSAMRERGMIALGLCCLIHRVRLPSHCFLGI
jgi:Nuclear condensing complex subunits, C-term domain